MIKDYLKIYRSKNSINSSCETCSQIINTLLSRCFTIKPILWYVVSLIKQIFKIHNSEYLSLSKTYYPRTFFTAAINNKVEIKTIP